MSLENEIERFADDKNLLRTVRECIKRNGGLHVKQNDQGEYYCRLSKYGAEHFCPYLGDPTLLHEKGDKWERWTRVRKCRLYYIVNKLSEK